jgi:hypothetical protein
VFAIIPAKFAQTHYSMDALVADGILF